MKILSAIKKEIQEIFHDRTMLIVLIVFPIFVMIFMGSSFRSMEINGLPIGIIGATNSTFSNALFNGLNNSNAFKIKNYDNEDQALGDFKNGELHAIIVVPTNFDQQIQQGNGSTIKIIVDNSDLALEQALLAAMSSVVQASSANITRSYVSSAWTQLDALNTSASSLADSINTSRNGMEDTKNNLSQITNGINNISIDALDSSLINASNSIGDLQGLIATQKMELANISSGNQLFLNNTNDFISNASTVLNESISNVTTTHSELQGQVNNLNNTIQQLDVSIAGLTAIQSATSDNTTKTALQLDIDGLQALKNSTQIQMVDTQNQISSLESLNQTLLNFSGVLTNYSAEVSTASSGQNNIPQLSQELDSVSVKLDDLNSSFVTARGEVEKLRTLLSQINSTSIQIYSTLDAAINQTQTVDALINSLHQTVAEQTGKDPNIVASPLTVQVENQYTRNSFVDFIMPQIISVSLLLSCFLLGSIILVREKTKKTIVRSLMIPDGLFNLVVGKVISLMMVSLVQVAIIILVAILVFGVNPPTNFAMLIWGTAISSLVLSSIGIIIGFFAKSEAAAIQTCLLIAIPMLFLGNIIFSADLLPTYTQLLQEALPLAHITNIFKIVMITNGNPAVDILALLSYFVLLTGVLLLILLMRRDITNYN